MEKKKKKLSITIEKEAESPAEYDFFLMKTTEAFLEIDLAKKQETKDTVEISVKQSFAISAEKMLEFCYDLIKTLQQYEEKYQNGNGLPFIPDLDEDSR